MTGVTEREARHKPPPTTPLGRRLSQIVIHFMSVIQPQRVTPLTSHRKR